MTAQHASSETAATPRSYSGRHKWGTKGLTHWSELPSGGVTCACPERQPHLDTCPYMTGLHPGGSDPSDNHPALPPSNIEGTGEPSP